MPIQIQAPDGSIVEFPDGTPDATIEQAMGQAFGAPRASGSQQRAQADAAKWEAGGDPRIRALTHDLTLGFGDELSGYSAQAATALANAGRRVFGQDIPYTSAQAREAATNAYREADEQFRTERPVQGNLAGFTGALMTPGLGPAARLVGKGANWATRAARAGGVGGAYGAVAGAGNADDGDRLGGAKRGAALGVALGSVAQPGAEVVGRVGQAGARVANKAAGGKILDPKKEAAKRLAERLEKDKVTPQRARQTADDWRATGASEPTIMDVAAQNGGEATKGLMRGAALKAGEGRSTARAYADRIEADLQDNVIRRTNALTPDKRTPAQVEQALEAERKASDDILYAAFQDEKVPIGDDIMAAIDGNAGIAILRKAYNAADVRRDARAKTEIDALLNYDAKEVSAGTLDLLRRTVRDMGGVQYRAGNNTVGAGFGGRADDIETALLDIDGFDKARRTHQGFRQRAEALEHGAKGALPGTSPDEFAAAITPETQAEVGIGYRQKLADILGGQSEGATGRIRNIATASNQTRNLEAAFPGEGPRYQQALANELSRLENARFINPNTQTQTAGRLADAADAGSIPTSKAGIVSAIVNKVRSGVTLTDAERREIVALGLGSPDDIPALLQRIERNPSLLQLAGVNTASSQ